MDFSTAQVQVGLASETCDGLDQIEARCEELARDTGFLHIRGTEQWPDGTLAARYTFRHSLYREVLYARLGPGRRSRAHLHIGRRMETAYLDGTDQIAGELAMHFERGGDYGRAVQYLTRSAEIALGRSAEDEALTAAETALVLLKSLSEGAHWREREMRLQFILGTALMSRSGLGAPEAAKAYGRAMELIEQLGQTPDLAPGLLGIAKFHIVRNELNHARELTERCLGLAQDASDPALTRAAHATLAAILYSGGQFATCLSHANQAIQQDLCKSPSDAAVYGLDSGVVATLYAGLSLWSMGFPDQARRQTRKAAAQAETLGHAHTWAIALTAEASVSASCRDWPRLYPCAEALSLLTEEKEIRFWHGWATFYRGLALAGQGQLEKGRALMRDGNAEVEASGADPGHGQFLCLCAEVELGPSIPREVPQVVSQAFTASRKNGYLLDQPELHRITGLLTLRHRDHKRGHHPSTEAQGKAQDCFLSAIETARTQGARSYELRAVMDLCRLWQSQGKAKEAHRMLSETYGWFSEGFDTGDLREARGLLEQLRP